MSERIKIFGLGGLDEDGKNCTIVEINNDIFVINCGIKFPDRTMPGIDYVIPQYDYLKENKDRIQKMQSFLPYRILIQDHWR